MNRPYVPPEALAEESRLREKAEAQLTEAREVLRLVTWVRADQVPAPCFHPADAHRWAFCVSCGTWSRADQPNDPAKLHAPDCRLDKFLRGVT